MKKIFIAIMLLFAANTGFVQADEPVILNPRGKMKGTIKGTNLVLPLSFLRLTSMAIRLPSIHLASAVPLRSSMKMKTLSSLPLSMQRVL